jgi:uncharacterized membrane protein YdjX (TVP38/TMEM64 family)
VQDSGRRGTYLAAAALLATGMLIVLLLPDDPLEHLARAVDAARARPGLAMLGLAALQVLTSVFLGPVWPGMAAAGYLFGVPLGALLGAATTTAGAGAAFAVGRYLARGRVQARLSDHARLAAMSQEIAANGFRLTFLARASMVVPANLLNYALAVSPIPGRTFMAATALGVLPAALVYALLGAALAGAGRAFRADEIQVPPGVFAGMALIVLVIAVLIWWRRARRFGGRDPAP